jgi:hypothetical protein
LYLCVSSVDIREMFKCVLGALDVSDIFF